MSAYAVVKVDRSTGSVVTVIARGMAYHHADSLAADLRPRGEDGFYFTAWNEKDVYEEGSIA